MNKVNEGSTSYHPIAFFDANEMPLSPSAIRYRVSDSKGVALVPWTNHDVNIDFITVSATTNTIDANSGTKRVLTVEATHGTAEKITTELVYELVNLIGFPGV